MILRVVSLFLPKETYDLYASALEYTLPQLITHEMRLKQSYDEY